MFVARASDYHLSATSPARDAGTALPDLPSDLDGIARPQGARFDIGAYERARHASPTPTATAHAGRVADRDGDRDVQVSVSGALQTRGGAPVPSVTLTLERRVDADRLERCERRLHVQRRAGGVWQLTPRKTGDLRSAVSALDAAWILQAVAQLRTLDAQQRLAADVTGDGTVSALDATLILQRAVGLNYRVRRRHRVRVRLAVRPQRDRRPEPVGRAAVAQRRQLRDGLPHLRPTRRQRHRSGLHVDPLGDVTGNWQSPTDRHGCDRADP